MSTFYSEFYGRLTWISRAQYLAGDYRYVCTEDGDRAGEHWDIVEDLETGDLYFTVI